MGFDVKFFTVAKRKNSTFQPADDTVKFTASCNLKESSGVLNPTISLSFTMESKPYDLNYAYIPLFGRYYYVTDWVYRDRLWWANLKVDVLASFRNEIIKKTFYFTRTSTAFDGNIIDTAYPAKSYKTFSITTGSMWEDSNWSKGTFVACILGQNGLVNYYLFKTDAWKSFIKMIFTGTDWMKVPVSDIPEAVLKAAFNPGQYLLNCFWLPIDVQTQYIPGHIFLGYWSIAFEGGINQYSTIADNQALINKALTYKVTKHPQSEARGFFLNHAPYTTAYLYSHVFGIMEIDMNNVNPDDEIKVNIAVDVRSGDAELRAIQGNRVLALTRSNIACPITVGNLQDNTSQTATTFASALPTLFNAATEGIVDKFTGKNNEEIEQHTYMSGVSGGIGNALTSLRGKNNVIFGKGSMLASLGKLDLIQEFVHITDNNNGYIGRPYCKLNTMETLGEGFYLVQNGMTSLTGAYSSETEQVRTYLEGGVFYA